MQQSRLNGFGIFFLATLLSVPALGSMSNLGANPAPPGTINYVEGHVTLGTHTLNMKSVGSAVLGTHESLTTGNGRAEILLTPGVFLRVADDSSITMVSPGLADTEVQLTRGRAMVEVAEIHDENNLLIDQDGARTRLLKKGLYDFDADRGQVRTFDGEATVQLNDRQVKVKGGHELNLNGPLKAQKFDKKNYEDSFYRWASLRSRYLSEANAEVARSYVNGGSGWLGAGWYWDPWFGGYTFVPGYGVFASPFGWSYYSPWWAYGGPTFFYTPGVRHFNRGFDHDFRNSRGPAIAGGHLGRGAVRIGPQNFQPSPGAREMHAGRGFGGAFQGGRRR
jgi:FecR protein